jgi:hypothetical protein
MGIGLKRIMVKCIRKVTVFFLTYSCEALLANRKFIPRLGQ